MCPKEQHLLLRSVPRPTSSSLSPLSIAPRPLSSPAPPSTNSVVSSSVKATSRPCTSAKLAEEEEEASSSSPWSKLLDKEVLEARVIAWRSEEVESGSGMEAGDDLRSAARDFSFEEVEREVFGREIGSEREVVEEQESWSEVDLEEIEGEGEEILSVGWDRSEKESGFEG